MRPRRRRLGAALVLGLALGGVACRPERPRVHKRHLAVLGARAQRGTLAVADDGETVAFSERTADGQRIVRGGVPGPTYPEISAPQFSPVARRLFYWARDPAHPGLVLVVEGAEVRTDLVRPGALVFSRDGLHWAVTGPVGTSTPRRLVVLADGRELGRSADASAVVFSPDGQHTAYLARDDTGAVALVVDGVARPPFPAGGSPGALSGLIPTDAPQSAVRYLSDGSLLVLAREGDAWVLGRDGRRLETYGDSRVIRGGIRLTPEAAADASAVFPDSIVTADGAPVAAWWERPAGPEERWRVVRDGAPVDGITCSRPFDGQPPQLSPDGRHIAYACFEYSVFGQDEGRVVVDGRRYGPYARVWGIRFGDDGIRAAWGAAAAVPFLPWGYFVDGRPYRLRFDEVWRPRLDAAGRHLAWQGQRGPRPQLGVDDGALVAFDEVLWGPKFTDTGAAAWVIRRGRKVTRVEVTSP